MVVSIPEIGMKIQWMGMGNLSGLMVEDSRDSILIIYITAVACSFGLMENATEVNMKMERKVEWEQWHGQMVNVSMAIGGREILNQRLEIEKIKIHT